MKYAGFYINLDRSTDRRERIEGELAHIGLGGRYSRFSAIDGNALHYPNPHLKDSEIGCFTSHARVLIENKDCPQPLHVIEDDIVLSPVVERMLDQLIEGGALTAFDLVYTDVIIPMTDAYCVKFKSLYDTSVKRDKTGEIESISFSMINMRGVEFTSTSSFLINPQSIGKLAALYEDELKRGARVAIDHFISNLCNSGGIKVGCLFPFITSVPIGNCFDSTIGGRTGLLFAFASTVFRHSFYVGCDLARCLEETSRVFPPPQSSDPHGQLITRLMEAVHPKA
jgi:hypothetical protein